MLSSVHAYELEVPEKSRYGTSRYAGGAASAKTLTFYMLNVWLK